MTLLLRARRALLALACSLALWLGVRLLAQALGFGVPLALLFLVPVAGLSAFVWPLSVRWVRVGRRLGLGGKLAGLVAAAHAQETAFLSGLVPQVFLRPWRLFFPEALALLPVVVLAGLLLLPVGPHRLPFAASPSPALSPEEGAHKDGLSAEPQRPEKPGSWARVLPQLPPDFPTALAPQAQLLAELLGEEVLAEEVWRRLSEEGVLRELAALLAQAAEQGWTSELREELAELVPELGRRELGPTASAQEEQGMVVSGAGPQGSGPEAGQGAPPEEGTAEARPKESPTAAGADILLDTEGMWWGKLEEGEEGLGLGAGWEGGEPVQPGTAFTPSQVEELLLAQVRPGEGPLRQGFALGLPGEAPGAEPPGLSGLSPAEAELLLAAKDLPPGLRDVVRRYFQLLAEGGGQ